MRTRQVGRSMWTDRCKGERESHRVDQSQTGSKQFIPFRIRIRIRIRMPHTLCMEF